MASALPLLLLLAAAAPAPPLNPREKKVRDDRAKVEAAGFWVYNDLPKAFAEAKATGKPLAVVLRCVPCEECVKLDDELVDADPVLRPLLEKFVRVRVVSTNGLDLSLFQFDTDQSFAVFLLNADGTIYGRFGTRSHRTNWVGDVSTDGLARALEGALALHADYPAQKKWLTAKRAWGATPEFPTPEQYPALKKTGRYTDKLNEKGNLVQSCVHCHQIGDARREFYRAKREPMPERLLFPYPHPKAVGLVLDPKQCATVTQVTPGSPAAAAGFVAGDRINSMGSQPMLSIADVQWVLDGTPANGGSLVVKVTRDGKPATVALNLTPGWRRADDISWRASSWTLRRMALGGLLLESTDAGLRVKFVGQNGPHATAKTAGVKVGDVIESYDGKTDWKRETDLLAYGVTAKRPGDQVPLVVVRNGQRVELTLPLPE